MASDESQAGLEGELNRAIDELHVALQRAADATAAIKALLPKVGAIGSLFDELDAMIHSGRQQISPGSAPATSYTRPTLVVPSTAARPAPVPQPFSPVLEADPSAPAAESPPYAPDGAETSAPAPGVEAPGLTCFRLEFESRPGPLDLRTVDDAVSEHPAVRDVALLDYDGRKATLKVWIDGSASPSDVQGTLIERSPQLFAAGNDVTIVALEDVA
jgi:hypothetical protein